MIPTVWVRVIPIVWVTISVGVGEDDVVPAVCDTFTSLVGVYVSLAEGRVGEGVPASPGKETRRRRRTTNAKLMNRCNDVRFFKNIPVFYIIGAKKATKNCIYYQNTPFKGYGTM